MSNADIKESRRILRLIQEHLAQAHLDLGAVQEEIGLAEVVAHPTSTLSHLNYVRPRKNTAWVPSPEIQRGIDHLQGKGRVARVTYIEGLYPPLFAKSLHALGLAMEQESSLMVYTFSAEKALPDVPKLDSVRVSEVTDQEGLGLWWYVWRNAFYDVITSGIEPIYIGKAMQQVVAGTQVDLLLYRNTFPIGAARLTFRETTAHLTTLTIMKDFRTPALMHVLYKAVLGAAQSRGADLVFTSGDSDENRQYSQDIGFVDYGSVVCYAESTADDESLVDSEAEDSYGGDVAQSVFALH